MSATLIRRMIRYFAMFLVWTPVALAGAPQIDIPWYSIDNGGGSSLGDGFTLSGSIGQPDARKLNGGVFGVSGGFWAAGSATGACATNILPCCDTDGDDIRDQLCAWCECDPSDGSCTTQPKIVPADIAGSFGTCAIDTFCNVHDRNHALTCFAGTNPCQTINLDAGGPFGSCATDGFCNIHDANHALGCFAGTNTCGCGPTPEMPAVITGRAGLRAVASRESVRPGKEIVVDAFVDGPVSALRSYQLELVVSGGHTGHLEPIHIETREQKGAIFHDVDNTFDAYNMSTGQMLHGMNEDQGAPVSSEAYLATYTYKASSDASGKFVIDIAASGEAQSVLVAPGNGEISIRDTVPAVVTVLPPSPPRRGE
jgi:hypothetical protein